MKKNDEMQHELDLMRKFKSRERQHFDSVSELPAIWTPKRIESLTHIAHDMQLSSMISPSAETKMAELEVPQGIANYFNVVNRE